MSSALEQISDVLVEHTLCQVGPMSALGQIEEIVNAELLRSASPTSREGRCPSCGRLPGTPAVGPSVTRGGQHTNDMKRCADPFHESTSREQEGARVHHQYAVSLRGLADDWEIMGEKLRADCLREAADLLDPTPTQED